MGIVTDIELNWRYSLPGGVLAATVVALSYAESNSKMSLGAVFFVGIIVGFLSKREYGSSKGTGALTGLIGAVPVVWILAQILTATSGLSGPAWFVAAGTITTVLYTLGVGMLGFALSALVGEVGARIGGAFTRSNSQPSAMADY
ncbi:DUF5518 domain-containing protein [Halovivax cerinus]|uniref:DUF5518 domain-containing protein n=1 Tax=Halovivax cerinus TaxID=1487865 RepID=A0ABD5NQU0_9EURY|nr:DUF5518 domain-containing protein [Halovivax cerinus]